MILTFAWDIMNRLNNYAKFNKYCFFLILLWTKRCIVHWNKIFYLTYDELKQDSKYWRFFNFAYSTIEKRNEDFKKTTLHFRKMRKQNKNFFNKKYQLQRIFLNVNNLMLRYDIKFDNKHNFKLIFRWNESFKMRKVNSIKKIYNLKKLNEICLNETYVENRLKQFRIQKMQIENIEKKKINLMKFWKNIIKFKKTIETVKKNFEENFEIKKKNVDQIEKLRKNQRNA